MLNNFIADLLVIFHLGFILFVILGGFLVIRWRLMLWIHLPCAIWGMLIEFAGWICPLTPLENRFRQLAGSAGYSGGFIDNYIIPIIYPAELTRELQIILGIAVILINLLAYGFVFRRLKRSDLQPKKHTHNQSN